MPGIAGFRGRTWPPELLVGARRLDHHRQAVPLAQHELRSPASDRELAHTRLRAGDIPDACDATRTALSLIEHISSPRVRERLDAATTARAGEAEVFGLSLVLVARV
jgi:hypothetical protein